jgi:hypothetical protein
MIFQITNDSFSLEDIILNKERELYEVNFQLQMPTWYMLDTEKVMFKADKVKLTNELRSLRKQLIKELELQKECEKINE